MVKPKVPNHRVLNSAILFDRWLRGLDFDRPIQFLTERTRKVSEDDLPAVKTAVKVLSSLNTEYRSFNIQVQKELKKVNKSKKRRKVVSKVNKID